MKSIKYITLCLAAALFGCGHEEPTPIAGKKSEVVLYGGFESRAAVIPDSAGLPRRQLAIGILTSNYAIDPDITRPTAEDWGVYTYLDRGYFGGLDSAGVVKNGEVKYTNYDGTATQVVFYDESGEYYIIRAVYPYVYQCRGEETRAQLILAPTASEVVFAVDGSQDVMTTNLVWGTQDSPSGRVNRPLRFRHLFTRLDVNIVAENEKAIDLYGEILSVELAEQPEEVALDIATNELMPTTGDARYPLITETGPQSWPLMLDTVAQGCGYVMAMPAQKYTFRVATQKRLNFYVDAVFPVALYPNGPAAGTAYSITLRFLSSDEVEIYPSKPTDWWYDSVFN